MTWSSQFSLPCFLCKAYLQIDETHSYFEIDEFGFLSGVEYFPMYVIHGRPNYFWKCLLLEVSSCSSFPPQCTLWSAKAQFSISPSSCHSVVAAGFMDLGLDCIAIYDFLNHFLHFLCLWPLFSFFWVIPWTGKQMGICHLRWNNYCMLRWMQQSNSLTLLIKYKQ